MARALIVGCGCRGRLLGRRLAEQGWTVRGTSRTEEGVELIFGAGLEGAIADPDRPGTIFELVSDVTVVYYLLGSMGPDPETAGEAHGSRLERLLEKLVDTPVRGFVYEAAGSTDPSRLAEGREIVERAGGTWSIPFVILEADPGDAEAWADAAAGAALEVLRR